MASVTIVLLQIWSYGYQLKNNKKIGKLVAKL